MHKVWGRGLGGSRGWVPPTLAAHGLLPAAAPVLSDEEPAAAHAARTDLPAAAGHPHHLFRTGLLAKLLHRAALPCPRQPWLARVSSCKQHKLLFTFSEWRAEQSGGMKVRPGRKHISKEPSWLHLCVSCICDAGISHCYVTHTACCWLPVHTHKQIPAVWHPQLLVRDVLGGCILPVPPPPRWAALAYLSPGKSQQRGELAVLLWYRHVTQPLCAPDDERDLLERAEACRHPQRLPGQGGGGRHRLCGGGHQECQPLRQRESTAWGNTSTRPASIWDQSGLLIS